MNSITRISTKATTKQASFPTEYGYTLAHGNLTIYKEVNGVWVAGSSFEIGDQAEYDSYNLSYTGAITKLTASTVTIQPKYGNGTKRLSMYTFAWRNFDFNMAETAARNHETSYNI